MKQLECSAIPSNIVSLPPSISSIFMKFDFQGSFKLGFEFIVILFSFLFVDIFDTVGTLIGVASKGDLLDEKGNLPEKEALLAMLLELLLVLAWEPQLQVM